MTLAPSRLPAEEKMRQMEAALAARKAGVAPPAAAQPAPEPEPEPAPERSAVETGQRHLDMRMKEKDQQQAHAAQIQAMKEKEFEILKMQQLMIAKKKAMMAQEKASVPAAAAPEPAGAMQKFLLMVMDNELVQTSQKVVAEANTLTQLEAKLQESLKIEVDISVCPGPNFAVAATLAAVPAKGKVKVIKKVAPPAPAPAPTAAVGEEFKFLIVANEAIDIGTNSQVKVKVKAGSMDELIEAVAAKLQIAADFVLCQWDDDFEEYVHGVKFADLKHACKIELRPSEADQLQAELDRVREESVQKEADAERRIQEAHAGAGAGAAPPAPAANMEAATALEARMNAAILEAERKMKEAEEKAEENEKRAREREEAMEKSAAEAEMRVQEIERRAHEVRWCPPVLPRSLLLRSDSLMFSRPGSRHWRGRRRLSASRKRRRQRWRPSPGTLLTRRWRLSVQPRRRRRRRLRRPWRWRPRRSKRPSRLATRRLPRCSASRYGRSNLPCPSRPAS